MNNTTANYYVDKVRLYNEIVQYNVAKKDDLNARMPEYIGKAILLICNGLAQRSNFNAYTYKQDMISDGIEDCVAAIKNFDPEKSKNPYGYLTQISWWAFVQRILIEKKQQYLKHKNYQNNFMIHDLGNSDGNMLERLTWSELSDNVIESFEKTHEKLLTKGKKPVKKTTYTIDSIFQDRHIAGENDNGAKQSQPKKGTPDPGDNQVSRKCVAKRSKGP